MKKFGLRCMLSLIMIGYSLSLASFANESMYIDSTPGDWGSYGSKPLDILDKIKYEGNRDFKIQETKLDTVNNITGRYPTSLKIANTLDYFRTNINPYLQWIVYLGLISATILIIWNGLQLTTKAVNKGANIKKVKENMVSIFIGVIIMTGFVIILRAVVSVLNYLFFN